MTNRISFFRLTGLLVYLWTGQRNYYRSVVPYVWGFTVALLIVVIVYARLLIHWLL